MLSLSAARSGPTGEFLQPLGLITEEGMTAGYLRQIKGLINGGADVIVIENHERGRRSDLCDSRDQGSGAISK